jgi:hypothetical protein
MKAVDTLLFVIPDLIRNPDAALHWIPAFAGMTTSLFHVH